MAYKYETQYNSPNYTPANQAQSVWGQPRTIKAIAIHWWGDPNTGPTYEGVISTLCNPNRGASAHFVATGTGRRVACLVNLADASWATNSANPWTISIECDPRCREEDYDVVAELIASIRSAYGDLPLVPHRQFVSTQCPGNYNLAELDRRARTKDGSGDWGDVKNIVTFDENAAINQIKQAYREILEREVDEGGLQLYLSRLRTGWNIDRVRSDLNASEEKRQLEARKAAAEAAKKNFTLFTEQTASDKVYVFNKDANLLEIPSGEKSTVAGKTAYTKGDEVNVGFVQYWRNGEGAERVFYVTAFSKSKGINRGFAFADLDVKPEPIPEEPESPSEPSQPDNGNNTPSEPEVVTHSFSEWLKEIFEKVIEFLSKFKRSK